MSRHLRAALVYARMRWPVFPCKPREKRPLSPNGLHDSTTDRHAIEQWWKMWPDANIGIPTGEASGFDVLDIDPRHGGDDSLKTLEQKYGPLPDTVEALTGGGGRHILFLHHPGMRNSAGQLLGLDVRGEGGYVVVAPSIHESGQMYEWELSGRPGEVDMADWPEGFLHELKNPSSNGSSSAQSLEDTIPDGKRNDTLMSLAGTMRRRNMTEEAIFAALSAENQQRCKPPLPEQEVREIAKSASRYQAHEDHRTGSNNTDIVVNPAIAETVDEFPLDALATPFRKLVEEAAAAIQCPGDFIAVPLLVSAGAAIGATRALQLKAGWEEMPALYAAIVGRPGDAKSPAQEEAVRYVNDRELTYHQQFEAKRAAFEAEQVQWETNRDRPKPQAPKRCRTVVADATSEALAQLLHENPRGLLLCRDELTGWVQSMDAYRAGKGGDRQFFLSAWSSALCSVDRKKQDPLLIARPFLAITGALQPDTVRSLLHEDRRDDGFVDRLLISYPNARPPQQWSEAVVSETTHIAVKEVFERLYGLSAALEGPVIVPIDGSAKKCWIEWYEDHQAKMGDVEENLRGVWAKAPGQAARLVLISHLVRWAAGETAESDRIDEDSMRCGIVLIEYFKSHARRVAGLLGESKEDFLARRVVEYLNRIRDPGVAIRDLLAAKIPGIRKSDKAKDVLDALVEAGQGEWRPGERHSSGQNGAEKFYLVKSTQQPRDVS